MNGKTRDERLRRLLREGDPADGETDLTTDELRAMRRAVLTAIPEPQRRLVPVLAGAAAAALVAILVLMIWPRAQSAPPALKATTKVAVKATPPPRRPAATETVGRRFVAAGLRARRPSHAPHAAPRKPRHTSAQEPDRLAQQNDSEPRTRQIQFSTAGGTRVIWILTSEKTL